MRRRARHNLRESASHGPLRGRRLFRFAAIASLLLLLVVVFTWLAFDKPSTGAGVFGGRREHDYEFSGGWINGVLWASFDAEGRFPVEPGIDQYRTFDVAGVSAQYWVRDHSQDLFGPQPNQKGWSIQLSLQFLLIAFSLLPLAWLAQFAWRRARENRDDGPRCGACGYDVRASADRCPECGHPISKSN